MVRNSHVAFTDTVRNLQERAGSRASYHRIEQRGWPDRITPQLAEFLEGQDSFYLGTANARGQPYIQHRGGPKGFLKPVDDRTLGFSDFGGNRQFISQGNLLENPKAFIFLMDYANARRIKIWGEAWMIEGDAQLLSQLSCPDYSATPERALLFKIEAWDPNCPQHIPRKYGQDELKMLLKAKDEEIGQLKARLSHLESR